MAKQNKQTADIFADNTTESSNKAVQPRKIVKRLPWHLQDHIPDMEHNHQASATIPDQTLTLLQLKNRMEQGLTIPFKQPVYNQDTYLPNWNKMDYVDRHKYLRQAEQTVKAKQKALDEYNATQAQAAKEAKKKEDAKKEDKVEKPSETASNESTD